VVWKFFPHVLHALLSHVGSIICSNVLLVLLSALFDLKMFVYVIGTGAVIWMLFYVSSNVRCTCYFRLETNLFIETCCR